ncbi:Transmembrane protein [Fasciola gigantica]|uniref:Transmembrane protein n=1 Tax=Fasciola gigantica TaxID=46835 RepID=A0A504XSV4_FASGI|nr:Transmembrane protein [Fasciola gigantica]
MSDSAPEDLFLWISLDPLEIMYTIIFGLFVACTVFPPLEFVAAGVTLENIFHRFLGSESTNFFEFHLRRTALLRAACSYFVLIYYFAMRYLSESVSLASPNRKAPFTSWDLVLWVGFAVATFVSFHTYIFWYDHGSWSGHPTVRMLQKIMETQEPDASAESSNQRRWRQLSSSINAECCHMDKFVAGQGGIGHNWPGRRFIVTDSWILASRFTAFTVIKQSADNLVAILVSSLSVLDPDSFTEGGRPAGENLGTQMVVTVRFVDVQTGVCLLTCGLPASNLDALRAKLQCPLIKARGVDLEPTIVQRFVQAFTEVVDEGDPIIPDPDLDLIFLIAHVNRLPNALVGSHICFLLCNQNETQSALKISMGAEQSNATSDHGNSLSSSAMNVLEPPGSSSLPPSPQHMSPPFSRGLSRESSKSVTVSNLKDSSVSASSILPLSSPGATSRMNRVRSGLVTPPSRSGQRSPSMGRLNRSSGVVVVCSGPIRRMRSTGSLDSVVHPYGGMDAESVGLKRLRQIPTFEPLIARSIGNREGSSPAGLANSSSGRRMDVSLPRVAPDELVAFVKSYGQHVQRCADIAYQQQTMILGLQNKVDYESRRVSALLQARENGTVPASPTSLSPRAPTVLPSFNGDCPSPIKTPDITYAGHQQVDAVVLQTSQISGLIDQCTVMLERLRDTIAQVKNEFQSHTTRASTVHTVAGSG